MQDKPDDFVFTEAEKDQLKRKRAMTAESPPATQRSEEYDDEVEDEVEGEDIDDLDDDEADELPNLQEYFDHFDIPDEQIISMCRAFASYLVSLRPKTPSKTPAKSPSKIPISQKVAHWMAKRRRT